jgi:hypothetical protein
MRSVTTFFTQSRTRGARASHAGARWRAQRALAGVRRERSVRTEARHRSSTRDTRAVPRRNAGRRPRPMLPLRGFLPLLRH